jgi:hypothetical protein
MYVFGVNNAGAASLQQCDSRRHWPTGEPIERRFFVVADTENLDNRRIEQEEQADIQS